MFRKTGAGFAVFVLAVGILLFSVFRTTYIRYSFSVPNDSARGAVFTPGVEYSLPYPGILPDHPLWFLKVLRDRVWIALSWDLLQKANKRLVIADKRLVAAKGLFDKGEYGLAVSTAQKAEKYLEMAFREGKSAENKGREVGGFYETVAKSSLTHREILEDMMSRAPGDAVPFINQSLDYPKDVYKRCIYEISRLGGDIPGNWENLSE